MKFIKAANFTPVTHRSIDLLVVHDMEMPEKGTTAEECAMFFHRQAKNNAGSSAHYCIDNNSVVQCVFDHDVAWSAPGANHDGLHFEHAGYARQTHRMWNDEFSTDMLLISAKLVSSKAHQYRIPITFLDKTEIRAGHRGITGHLQITRSGIGGAAGTHTDPGDNFPWIRYLRYVKAYSAGHHPARFMKGEL